MDDVCGVKVEAKESLNCEAATGVKQILDKEQGAKGDVHCNELQQVEITQHCTGSYMGDFILSRLTIAQVSSANIADIVAVALFQCLSVHCVLNV